MEAACIGWCLGFLGVILALVAISRSGDAAARLKDVEKEASDLRTTLEALQKRLQLLERPKETASAAATHAEPPRRDWSERPADGAGQPVAQPQASATHSQPPAFAPPPETAEVLPSPPSPSGPLPPWASPVALIPQSPKEPEARPLPPRPPALPAAPVHPSIPAAQSAPPKVAVDGAAPPPPAAPTSPLRPAPPPATRPAATMPPAVPLPRPAVRTAFTTSAEDSAPPPSPPANKAEGGWERKLGIILPVWIGAIALIIGGGFLVKISIERGYLGPTARVAIATLFGAALLGAGEWLRKRYSLTAQGASAAGVAVLYAAFLAGTLLYHLITPWVGFGLVALVTASAVALSLRQGMMVAILGLVGGFFTPYWIGIVSASPARLFAYILLLQAGLIFVTRKRQWTGLAALTLVMGLGAALHRLIQDSAAMDAPWIGAFLLLSAASFVLAAGRWGGSVSLGPEREPTPIKTLMGCGALAGAFLALAALAAVNRFSLQEWAFLGILSAACLVLGRMDRSYARMPWVAYVVTLLLQVGWLVQSHPADRTDIWIVAACSAALFGIGAFAAHFGSAEPGTWGALSAMAGLSAFGIAWSVDKLHGHAGGSLGIREPRGSSPLSAANGPLGKAGPARSGGRDDPRGLSAWPSRHSSASPSPWSCTTSGSPWRGPWRPQHWHGSWHA